MKIRQSLLLALGLGLVLIPTIRAQAAKNFPAAGVGEDVLLEVTATVLEINVPKRELTLQAQTGNVFTVPVDKKVKRFKEIKVGDKINASYYASVAAEIRPPTEEEKAKPYAVLKDDLKTTGGAAANAGMGSDVLRVVRVVTSVEGLDRPNSTVTIKGPIGNYRTVKVKDPANLDRLRLGEFIVVTYTEALAIDLKPTKK